MAVVKRVVVGGTFSIVHKGHEALLKRAFEVGSEVLIGVTSDRMVESKGRRVPPAVVRVAAVARLAARIAGEKRYDVVIIDDPFGPTLTEDFGAIVVSEDTEQGAREINARRETAGRKPIEVIVVEMILAVDGKPVSSTRIADGTIGPDGKVSGSSRSRT
jgi:cytidyltransferase-like protein